MKLSDLKLQVLDKAQNLLAGKGYRLNKNQCKFRRDTESAVIEFAFKFYSYYPTHNEYSFQCTIILKELVDLITEYNNFFSLNTDLLWNVLIVEGEFIDDLVNKERKFQKIYNNEVDTPESIEKSIDQTLKIIEFEVLPLVEAANSLSGFQKNFLQPEKIMKRINEENFILSCLLAAFLIDVQFYSEISKFITIELDKKKNDGIELSSIYLMIDNLNIFFSSKIT